MTDFFPIYEVLDVAGSQSRDGADVVAAEQRQSEQMGSKRKFWFCDTQTSRWYLFKYSRDATGEHWSEKVACEIASLLGLPHARVHLAKYHGSWGALVEDLRPDRAIMSLLHGNELMLELDPTYQAQQTYRCSEHTVERVAHALHIHDVGLPDGSLLPQALPVGVEDALGLFIGYLLLDAVIANTDRHHENWGVVAKRDASGARVLQLAGTTTTLPRSVASCTTQGERLGLRVPGSMACGDTRIAPARPCTTQGRRRAALSPRGFSGRGSASPRSA